MIKKIDMNSEEFETEFELTKKYTEDVLDKYGFVFNPNEEINESIQQGLTRNQMIYGTRFCPCFMVIGNTLEEQRKNEENRLCPCTPALENEIPNTGSCHCGIYCTKEYANKLKKDEELKEVSHSHSRGLSKQECEELLKKELIDSDELESLLEARELGYVDFNLVDNREWMEWVGQRIKGVDYLVPTTSFYQSLEQIENQKDKPTIVYCLSGSRSAYCKKIMQDMGFKSVTNLNSGVMGYKGEMLSGE
ncbi:ferredoxin-thioredoxin reductase catalytic domain-containing protein [Arcobacter sp. CECT 8985]|uniref:ferredoxin-thioredoxin reductase catalytic domain-containing protein n=1 Tax=Arcobacter sp. CECT 8985 TaxID=1935424 RepID=UPI00100B4059|nr:ferredoxin-thioredoxin reductase catalytic domain-containing protein [Arcobacter sp. CECT 8985]RXJ87957.1 sulfurtransferase [Arcobacter sp. CECT 8985]